MIVKIEVAEDVSLADFQVFLDDLHRFVMRDSVRSIVRDVVVEPEVLLN
jgi:hypothetical protein